MCGRAAIAFAADRIISELRAAGVQALPRVSPSPEPYHVGSKSCEERTKRNPKGVRGVEGWPCLVRQGDELAVRTLTWGIQRLATHNIWLDGGDWLQRKTWREALAAGRLCAVAVTAFAEGVTCRKPDGEHPLFFLAALYCGSHFVILTTNSVNVPLLAERAKPQALHGVPTRCPLYLDAAGAQRWLSVPPDVDAIAAAVGRIEASLRLGPAGTHPP